MREHPGLVCWVIVEESAEKGQRVREIFYVDTGFMRG